MPRYDSERPLYRSAQTQDRLFFWGILLLGSVVRFYRLEAQSLWADEGLQYALASAESVSEVLSRVQDHTFHPPLSYLINHVFLRVQDSDWFLRLPSVLFGIASLPLAYSMAKRLTSINVATGALLVMAISPMHIWFSQEARMYAPLLFMALASTWCLLQAVGHNRVLWWGGYVVVSGLGLFLHVFMALNILVHVLWILLWHRRDVVWSAACGIGAALLAFPVTLHWGEFVLRRLTGGVSVQAMSGVSRAGVGWEGLLYTLYVYGAGFSLGPDAATLHVNRSLAHLLPFWPSILAVGLVFGGLLVLGVIVMLKRYCVSALGLCVLGLVIPMVGVMGFTLASRFAFNARYTLVAYPYFCLLIGVALSFLALQHRGLLALAGIALVGLSAVSLSNYFTRPQYAKEDVRAAVNRWRSTAAEGYLLSCSTAGGIREVVKRYMGAAQADRHIWVAGNRVVEKVSAFFNTHEVEFAYILFARDWHHTREQAVRAAFEVREEYTYPGVRLMKIVPP